MGQAAVSAEATLASYAKNNDPSTWGTYEQALAVFEAGQCDGIGFNLPGTDFAAFDIDKCRDPATGDIAPEAMAIVDRATSYTEITVSGTGLRVIGYGSGAKLHRKQKLPGSPVEVESYQRCRTLHRHYRQPAAETGRTWPTSTADRRRRGRTRRSAKTMPSNIDRLQTAVRQTDARGRRRSPSAARTRRTYRRMASHHTKT